QITVRVPIGKNIIRDLSFPADIPRNDFLDRIYAQMSLNRERDELGWQTCDVGDRAAAQRLADAGDVDQAFDTILDMMKSTRRKKPVFMKIKHLNPVPIETSNKKKEGTRKTDFAYNAELTAVNRNLKCAQHPGENRWCYINPEKPTEHIALGLEEITLWARKIHDNEADSDCLRPPHCLRLDDLRERGRVRSTVSKTTGPPIHVHITNTPLGSSGGNVPMNQPSRGLKRQLSSASESSAESDGESLPLTDVVARLHRRYPQLALPQYLSILKDQGIVYAESV
ncbi:hypothetical protein M413DRAFT_56413, partial [Hebeloma cylindrosporum]